jgi:FAD synthetase
MASKSKGTEKSKVVLASGVFDLLHLGHVRFLEEAKKAGGPNAKLVVVVARDSTVEKEKGKKPVMPEYQRCALVASLKVVAEAMLGYENLNMGKVLGKIKPDIVAVGHDSHISGLEQTVRKLVKEKGLKIRIVKIGKFSSDELDSSSKIKQRIAEQLKR